MKKTPQSKAERTKRFIIETAAPIFNKKGYYGTSLSDLTQATGLTKGGIYGNFANKEELAVHAFQHNVAFISDAFRQGIAAEETYIGKLLAYPRVYQRLKEKLLNMGGCPILNTAVEADDTNPVLSRLGRGPDRILEKQHRHSGGPGAESGRNKNRGQRPGPGRSDHFRSGRRGHAGQTHRPASIYGRRPRSRHRADRGFEKMTAKGGSLWLKISMLN